eukprot:gene12777-biopygen11021
MSPKACFPGTPAPSFCLPCVPTLAHPRAGSGEGHGELTRDGTGPPRKASALPEGGPVSASQLRPGRTAARGLSARVHLDCPYPDVCGRFASKQRKWRREKRQRTRTGRGPHDIIQRNGRGPDGQCCFSQQVSQPGRAGGGGGGAGGGDSCNGPARAGGPAAPADPTDPAFPRLIPTTYGPVHG